MASRLNSILYLYNIFKKNYGSDIFCKASFIFNWKNFNTLLVKKNYLYINEVELFISHGNIDIQWIDWSIQSMASRLNSILYLCLNCQNMQLDKTVYLRKMYILLFQIYPNTLKIHMVCVTYIQQIYFIQHSFSYVIYGWRYCLLQVKGSIGDHSPKAVCNCKFILTFYVM
jgi:hypothetical protein